MTRLPEKQILVVEAASIVARAARLIGHPARWTKRHWALDGRGRDVRVDDPAAVRFCLVGALLRAEHELHGSEVVYSNSAQAGAPMVTTSAAATRLALALLAHPARLQLHERGVRFSLAPSATERDTTAGGESIPQLHQLDLPVMFNGFPGVGQADCLSMLIVAGQQLIFLNDLPELLDRIVSDNALGEEPKRRGIEPGS